MNNPKHIDPRLDPSRTIRAPRGSEKTCKTWIAEAAYRMIQNNLDPEVAEHPHALIALVPTSPMPHEHEWPRSRRHRPWWCAKAIPRNR